MANKLISLNKTKDFQTLYKTGGILRKRGIILRYAENERKNQIRLAYGISKKIVRKANQRNKIKRWGRFFLRSCPALKSRSLDFLIIIIKPQDNYKEFEKTMTGLMRKMK